jgi:hypothetical protein
VADAGQETGAKGGVGDRLLSWAGWASVADLLAKTGCRDRAGLVAHAYRTGRVADR